MDKISLPHIASSFALKPYQVELQAKPTKKLMVRVRREDTTIQEIEVMEEYQRFTEKCFPKYEQKFLQFPEVFATKLKTEGFPEKKKLLSLDSLKGIHMQPGKWQNMLYLGS